MVLIGLPAGTYLRQKAYCSRLQWTRKLVSPANSLAIALVKPSRVPVARVKARRNTALDLTGSLLPGSALTLPISWAGCEAPQYSQVEDETYVPQRLSRGS